MVVLNYLIKPSSLLYQIVLIYGVFKDSVCVCVSLFNTPYIFMIASHSAWIKRTSTNNHIVM